MDFLRRLLDAEPAVVIATVTSVLALAVNFGLPLTGVQADSIVQAVANILLLLGAVLGIRESVYAPDTVRKIVEGGEE